MCVYLELYFDSPLRVDILIDFTVWIEKQKAFPGIFLQKSRLNR